MSAANQPTRRSGTAIVVYGVRFLLILALNFFPVLAVRRLDNVLPAGSSDQLKIVFLQAMEDVQEYLFSLQEPLFSEFVSRILSEHPDDDTRDLISKSESLSAFLKVWTVKIPSAAITVASALPKTQYSLLAVPAVAAIWAVWYFLFSPVIEETQSSKWRRDKAIKGRHVDGETRRQEYARAQLRLAGHLGLWRALRITCCALLVYSNRGLDKTLMSRLSHQLASVETILTKETQNRIRTVKIVFAAFWRMELGKDTPPDYNDRKTSQGSEMITRDMVCKLGILWSHLKAASHSSLVRPRGKLQGGSCTGDPDRSVQEDHASTEGSRLVTPETSLYYGTVKLHERPDDLARGGKPQVGFCVGRRFDHQRLEGGGCSDGLSMV